MTAFIANPGEDRKAVVDDLPFRMPGNGIASFPNALLTKPFRSSQRKAWRLGHPDRVNRDVRHWHLADIDNDPEKVRFEG
jgi:hypothetical protein